MRIRTKSHITLPKALLLLALYIFVEAAINFPLAWYDYEHGTEWLYYAPKSSFTIYLLPLIIFYIGYRMSETKLTKAFTLRGFNPLIFLPLIFLVVGMEHYAVLVNNQITEMIPIPPWFKELFERATGVEENAGKGIINWDSFFHVVFFAPFIEETLFRGLFLSGFLNRYKTAHAVFLSALLFSLFHMNPWQIFPTFILGLICGWLFIKSRSLVPPILAHTLHNGIIYLANAFPAFVAENPVTNILIGSALPPAILLLLGVGTLLVFFPTRKSRYHQ